MWQMTHNTLHVTCDAWHVAPNTWHVTPDNFFFIFYFLNCCFIFILLVLLSALLKKLSVSCKRDFLSSALGLIWYREVRILYNHICRLSIISAVQWYNFVIYYVCYFKSQHKKESTQVRNLLLGKSIISEINLSLFLPVISDISEN